MWPFGRTASSESLGKRGEKLASKFLRKQGCRILARNYRCPAGEADIVAMDRDDTLVFVEVKTRSSNYHTDPQSAVNADKQRRLRNVAKYFLSAHKCEELNVRFDVISIVMRDGGPPEIEYIKDAF